MGSSDVLAAIRAAFPAEPVPPRSALVNDHCPECTEVSEAFAFQPWTAVTLDQLLRAHELALLTPVAWRYYVPAAMTWAVQAPDALDVILDNLVYELEPPFEGDKASLHEWFDERLHDITPAQREAFIAFLRWYKQREDAEYLALAMAPPAHASRALDYWTAYGISRAG